ncbi:MAG: terpene cyclase/mutase family protein, partial [Planctomycetales bacterium]|nr:terpene cyclase/mutase family protein [Planctomycetales bacterium]
MATNPANPAPGQPPRRPAAPPQAQPMQAQPVQARPAQAMPGPQQAVPAQQQAMAAQAQATAQTAEPDEEGDEESYGTGGKRFILFNAVPSWMVSMVVHAVLLIVLAMLSMPSIADKAATVLNFAPNADEEEELEELEIQEITPLDVQVTETVTTPVSQMTTVTEMIPTEVTNITPADDLDAAPAEIEFADFSERTAPKSDLMQTLGTVAGKGLEGRGAAARSQMVAANGGTKGSEAAVAAALKWLAVHQLPNGSWSFDHRVCPNCQGRCTHPGTLTEGNNGATAMALLPFLGAGQTHMEGEYKDTVRRGLYFLSGNMKLKPGALPRGELSEAGGSMYSHGLCAIVLCEAYAMTHDRALMQPAQLSLNHIVYAQDPVGGGWRYQPRTPGDTSVVGWQLMALKSGHMAYLQVPPITIQGAIKFLDSVQSDSGGKYGYTAPGGGSATTAVGLLCRMYLGWKKDHPGIERGVEYLSTAGPSKNNMYFNYYATQVMRHYEGEKWDKWNVEMRDWLVNTQSKNGHEAGSWWVSGGHGERGGRLYTTSMATMILEVYYRHMPIYGKQAA